jgi:hypothetical protein
MLTDTPQLLYKVKKIETNFTGGLETRIYKCINIYKNLDFLIKISYRSSHNSNSFRIEIMNESKWNTLLHSEEIEINIDKNIDRLFEQVLHIAITILFD